MQNEKMKLNRGALMKHAIPLHSRVLITYRSDKLCEGWSRLRSSFGYATGVFGNDGILKPAINIYVTRQHADIACVKRACYDVSVNAYKA